MNGKNSTKFQTTCDIRQGAPSSALLFIVFINDLIDYIQQSPYRGFGQKHDTFLPKSRTKNTQKTGKT